MDAREALRLRFVHAASELLSNSCQGIMANGSACKLPRKEEYYGFLFCGRHYTAASAWVNKTSLDGKGQNR